jgi:hypothetical protein
MLADCSDQDFFIYSAVIRSAWKWDTWLQVQSQDVMVVKKVSGILFCIETALLTFCMGHGWLLPPGVLMPLNRAGQHRCQNMEGPGPRRR